MNDGKKGSNRVVESGRTKSGSMDADARPSDAGAIIEDASSSILSTAHLAAIVESSDDAIISKDLNSIITTWNAAAERIFGFSAEEAIGRHISIIIPDRFIEEEASIMARIRNGLKADNFDTVRQTKDGSKIHVAVTVSPIFGTDGSVVGASKIARDITRRKETEERLSQNQMMLSLAMQSSQMGAWERDLATDVVWWSPELEEIFGLRKGGFAESLEGFNDLIHDDDRQMVRLEVQRAIEERRPYSIEFRFHHADGSIRWMEGRGEAVYSQKGEPVRLYGVGLDITDRKVAELNSRFLTALDRTLQDTSDPSEAMNAASRMLCEHLEADRCAYAEIEDEKIFVITGDYSRAVPSIVGRLPVASFGDECARSMLDNIPYVVFDTDTDARIALDDIPAYRATNIQAVVCVPLHKDGKFSAAMAVHQKVARHWTEEEVKLVQLAVNRCWETIERLRAARNLRESDERFRALMEQAPFSIQVYAPDGQHIRVNRAWEDLWGVRFEDIPEYNVLHDKQLEEKGIASYIRRAFEGEAVEIPAVEYDPDKTIPNRSSHVDKPRWVSAVAYPLKDTKGLVREVVLVHQDITERRKAESTVERQAKLIDLSYEPIFVWSETEGILEWNAGCEQLYGYTREEALGKTSHELLNTRRPLSAKDFMAALRDSGEWTGELCQTTRDGTEVIVESRHQLIEINGQQLILESNRDVTSRKEVESITQRYQLLSEHARDVIWLLRPDGEIVEANRAAEDLYGYTREEFEGMNVRELRHPDTLAELGAQLKGAADEGVHFETVHLKKDGTPLPVEVTANGADIGGERFLMSIVRDISERKRAEMVLRESEERFAKAFNASPLVVTITSLRTGLLTEVNETFCEVTGYSRDEAVGRSTDELGLWLTPEDRAAELETLTTDGSIRNSEYIFRLRDGSELVGLLSAEVLEIGGEPSALTVIQDVTERKRVEESLRLSERRLQEMADAMPQVVWVANAAGDVTYMNKRVREFYKTDESVADEIPRIRIHPEDYEASQAAWRQARETKTDLSIEHRLEMADGGYCWHLSRAVPVLDNEGNVLHWYGTTTDIHELKIAEEKMVAAERRAAEEYYAMLSRIVPLAQALGTARDLTTIYRGVLNFIRSSMPCSAFFISFYDSDTNLRIAAFAWGVSSGEVDISQLPPLTLNEDGGPNSQAVFTRRAVIVNRYMDHMKKRPHMIVKEDGVNPNSSVAVPMIVMDRVMGTIEVQAYENQAFNDEHVIALEMVANLAAVAIENVRLIETEGTARKEAEAANKMKDEFLSVLSHELRTPLNAMLGWVRMLRTGLLDPERTAKALEVIERNTRQQGSLIEDLLDVSRIISGRMRVETSVIDLVPVVSVAAETVKPLAFNKNIELGVSTPSEPLFMDGDSVRMQQVITNLLQNAVKFTPAGGRVDLWLERVENSAVITVSDTGVGIEESFLPYIFDRFSQADASSRRNYTGLGLGLTIVRNIIDLHNGEIRVSSDGADKGSTFTVTLPLQAEFYDKSNASDTPVLSSNGRGRLKDISILLVDDDVESLQPLQAFLESQKATVVCANSVNDALTKLAVDDFHVLVSDIGMPSLDGYQLIHLIRNMTNGRNSRIPAIALTAYASEDDRQKALSAGFQEHLVKPADYDAILKAIENARRPLV